MSNLPEYKFIRNQLVLKEKNKINKLKSSVGTFVVKKKHNKKILSPRGTLSTVLPTIKEKSKNPLLLKLKNNSSLKNTLVII